MFEQYHPLGPVGVITAFNFPVAVWSWNAMIALIAGDTVVWKPSSKVPLCAIAANTIAARRDNGLRLSARDFERRDRHGRADWRSGWSRTAGCR